MFHLQLFHIYAVLAMFSLCGCVIKRHRPESVQGRQTEHDYVQTKKKNCLRGNEIQWCPAFEALEVGYIL